MILELSEPTLRLTRRSLLISATSAAALLAMPGSLRATTLAAQTNGASVFFDPAVIHEIVATFDQDEYDAMIATYSESGDKEWLSATVTIDGQTFEQVGLRLKGNSSLSGLRQGGFGPGGNMQPAGPATGATPEAGADASAGDTTTQGPGFNVGVGMGGNISADEPQGLPWLVRLDKYVDDQNFNGLTEFVIRSNNSETALNEALALDLLAEAGLASQAATYVKFTANDSEPRLRLAIENPDDTWMAYHFSDDGTLFKSEADGNWSDKGDDLDAYMQAFDLEAGGGDDDAENYAPLIAFLDFVNNSDDATFASDLPNHLNVDLFAAYLAMMDLIQNTDDIDGPGNNSYLFYDDTTGIVTIVPWDMNLAFGGMGGFGAGGRGGGGQFPGGGQMTEGTFVINGTPVAGQLPAMTNADGTPIAGQFPSMTDENGTPIAGMQGGAPDFQGGRDGNRGGMGGFGGGNPLVQRWNEVDAFTTLQADARTQLASDLFESGVATGILARWVDVLNTQATGLIDQSTIDSESQSLQEQIDAI